MKYKSSTLKRIVAAMLVFCLLAAYYVPMGMVAADNLLTDGGFDNGLTPLAVDTYNPGVWTSVASAWHINNEPAYSGTTMAHLVYATTGVAAGTFPCIYQDVAVQPNSIYRMTFYVKHWNAGAELQPLYYGYRNPQGADVWAPVEQYSITDLALDSQFHAVTLEFDTKDLTAIRVFAFTTSTGSGFGGYQIDDFKLELVRADNAEESGGLLTDGSFNTAMTVMANGDDPSVGKWTSMSWASANKEYANAYSGSGLAHLVCAATGLDAGAFPTIYQDVEVQPNSVYRLTFYAKKWNVGATTNPLYYGYRNALQDVWTPVEQYEISDLDNNYRKITLEFDTKELTTIRVFAFTQSVSGGAAGYHLDDFKLELVRADNTEESGGLLTDGSFNTAMTVMANGDDPSIGKWTSMSWASANQEYANAYSGSGLAHLVCAATGLDAGAFPTIYQDVEVQPNSVYRLTFYAKKWNIGATTNPLYYGYRNALQDVWTPIEQLSAVELGNDYTKLSMEFKTGSLTCVRIFAFTQSVSGGAAGYHLDDFKLELVRADNTEESGGLLTDGSFNTAMTVMADGDAPSIGKWTSMSWASAVKESANSYAGSGQANLVYAASGLDAGAYPTIYQDVEVEADSVYRLTFYAKNWNVGAAVQPLYFGYRNGTEDVWVPIEQVQVTDLTGEYKQLSMEIKTGSLTCIRVFAFTTSVTGGIGGYHLDNFKLEKVSADNAQESGGLLTDGSFDHAMTVMSDGNLPSIGKWTSMSWASAVKESANSYAGSGLANLVYAASGLNAGEYPTIYQDVNVEAGSIYRLTFYAKNWDIGAEQQLLYYGYRNGSEDVWVPVEQLSAVELGNDYTKLTMEFKTGSLTCVRIFAFTTSVEGGAGGYHLDNFKLEKIGTDNTQSTGGLLTDGSFNNAMTVMTDGDDPSIGKWTSMSWASAVKESANSHAGSGLANLVYAASGLKAGEYPTIYQDVEVKARSVYRLTFYAKNWNIDAEQQPLYYGYRNGLEDVFTPVEQYSVTDLEDGYQKITLEFDTKELTTVRIFAFTTSVAGGTGGYHLDDFCLEYVGEGEPPEQDDPKNMILNGGFIRDMEVMKDGDDPSIGKWTSMSWAATVYEKNNARTGKGLANLVYAASGLKAGEYPTIYQDVEVKARSVYRLTFYAKNWNIDAEQQPLYYGYRNGLEDVFTPVEQYSVTDLEEGYQKITLEFDTKELTTIRVFAFTTSVEGGTGGYHLDDFYLEYVGEGEPPEEDDPENLLVNGSFIRDMEIMTDGDEPSVGKWTSMSWASTIYEKENAHKGGSLANMVISASGLKAGEYPTIYQDVEVEPYKLYTVTFYAKKWSVSGGDSPLYYGYRNALKDVWTPVAQYSDADIGEEYEKMSFTFYSGDLTRVRIFAFTQAVDSEGISGYHLDNFYMTCDGEAVTGNKVAVSADTDKNLVYNSSFEINDSVVMPTDATQQAKVWTYMDMVLFDRNMLYSYTGACNLVLPYSAEGLGMGSYPTIWQDVEVDPDTWYEISFYARQWGVDGKNDNLFSGIRDPKAKDIWTNVVEHRADKLGAEYERITIRFHSGDMQIVRLFLCTISQDYRTVGGAGGYHIDDVQLRKLSEVTKVDFRLDGQVKAGEKISYTAAADHVNGSKGVLITAGGEVEITFESKDEGVVRGDISGNLAAVGAGTTEIRMIATIYGQTVTSEWKTVTVQDNPEKYIANVKVKLDGNVTTGSYTSVGYEILRSDDVSIAAGACEITVVSDDPNVVWVKQRNDGYVLYGAGQGSATVYVTVEADGMMYITTVDVTVDDGNYLKDSSFEMQSGDKPFWTIRGDAAFGVDDSSTNTLANNGNANIWCAAPISWSDAVLYDSEVEVYQDVALKAGSYTLSAFINRFYATGSEGMLSELGGTVELCIMKLKDGEPDEDNVQISQFDVTYGVGGYQQLDHYVTLTEDGVYRVCVRVVGDEQFGMGMQLDDVSLCKTQYPESVSVSLSQELTVDGMAQLIVTARYADGTEVVLEDGLVITVSDETVAKIAGRNILGIKPGTTQVEVTVQIAGQSFHASCDVTVTGQEKEPVQEDPGTPWYLYVLCALAVTATAAVIVVLIVRKKKADK